MLELSKERIEKILHEETVKKEDPDTILRAVYTRYMNLYEQYIADLDALDDDKIAVLRNYHEETKSLVKYYYMDIPQDVCEGIREFETKYSDNLLGPDRYTLLKGTYEDFKEKCKVRNKSEDYYNAEFKKQLLEDFYSAMNYVFREGFGTGSQMAKNVSSGIMGLLFGKSKD